jgi:hypothetical protein
MDTSFFESMHKDGAMGDASYAKYRARIDPPLISVHWDLRTILYIGVLSLSTGLGILVYKNIDSIGHTAVLISIVLISLSGYSYCFKKKLPFSIEKVNSPDSFFDYILLLASLSFIIFIGYWQYQYQVFGDRYGLVAIIPTLVLFFTAYFFDQLGILSLAITNLCAWAGIVVTPTKILASNDFNSGTLIVTGIVVSLVLIAAGKASTRTGWKSHFAFTYINFGMNIIFISCLAGIFHFDSVYLIWFLLLSVICGYFYWEAVNNRSFYFILMLTLYGYIGLSYVVLRLLFYTISGDTGSLFLASLYFIGSGIGLVFFLMRMNKKIKVK